MNRKSEKKSTRSDVSGGEKMSENKILPKKPMQTIYGEVGESEEEKKFLYWEVGSAEDKRITNAQTGLHSRLSEEEKAEAYKWTAYFKGLIEGVDE
jgi:hypothetical protein|tara:strand:- start:97 stop:384 length:288 start_codon:yes stop_codon:yes gene_type:complete